MRQSPSLQTTTAESADSGALGFLRKGVRAIVNRAREIATVAVMGGTALASPQTNAAQPAMDFADATEPAKPADDGSKGAETAPENADNPYFCTSTSDCIDKLPYLLAEVDVITGEWLGEAQKGVNDDTREMPNGKAKRDLRRFPKVIRKQLGTTGSDDHFVEQDPFNEYLGDHGCETVGTFHETLVKANCHYEKLIRSLYATGMAIALKAEQEKLADPTAIANARRQLQSINPDQADPDKGYKGREAVLVGNAAIFRNFPPELWPVPNDLVRIDTLKPNQDLVDKIMIITPIKGDDGDPIAGVIVEQSDGAVKVDIGVGEPVELKEKDWGKEYNVSISDYPGYGEESEPEPVQAQTPPADPDKFKVSGEVVVGPSVSTFPGIDAYEQNPVLASLRAGGYVVFSRRNLSLALGLTGAPCKIIRGRLDTTGDDAVNGGAAGDTSTGGCGDLRVRVGTNRGAQGKVVDVFGEGAALWTVQGPGGAARAKLRFNIGRIFAIDLTGGLGVTDTGRAVQEIDNGGNSMDRNSRVEGGFGEAAADLVFRIPDRATRKKRAATRAANKRKAQQGAATP